MSDRPPRLNYSQKIPTLHQHAIEQFIFKQWDAVREQENHCVYRAKIERDDATLFIRQYTNGRLRVDGPDPLYSEVVQALEQFSIQEDEVPSVSTPPKPLPIAVAIGSDESGKGDYFGGVTVAAFYADAVMEPELRRLGVRDSKQLGDTKILQIAQTLWRDWKDCAEVILLPPEAYNERTAQLKTEKRSTSYLLAELHRDALQAVYKRKGEGQMTAVVDEFPQKADARELLYGISNLDIMLQTQAEQAHIAVAAASILARARFVLHLENLSKRTGMPLLKGASDPRIIQIGSNIYEQYGMTGLEHVAKLHFATTQKIIGE